MKRKVYTTPKSYIDLVKCYKDLLQKKKEQLSGFLIIFYQNLYYHIGNRNKLVNGLNKLSEANSTITDLKSKLVEL